MESSKDNFEPIPFITAILAHFGFYLLMITNFFNQLLIKPIVATEKNRDGYPKLFDPFEQFYLRYVYRRGKDAWDRPIASCPGGTVQLKERISKDYWWTWEFTGKNIECINLGSYNYLGFAQPKGPCADDAVQSIKDHGIANCSSRRELGTNPLHNELEELTAKFLGTEDAIIFGMGFATNSLNIPSVLSSECLVVSDEKNHASIVLGLRLSGATIKVYNHNNMKHLEKIISQSIIDGQPKSRKPWKKIFIFVEGIFSMEGSIINLPEIIRIKKKYKVYIYMDEAHSVGSTGEKGRGIIDYFGVDPNDIDILMGTFTKSFGSAGGYIAGSKNLISFFRTKSHAHCYASSMAPAVTQQIITSMKIIMGLDGTNEGRERINRLARNARYFRKRLAQIGVITYGHDDSPIIPMIVYIFSKLV